jgi:hypothetical protein
MYIIFKNSLMKGFSLGLFWILEKKRDLGYKLPITCRIDGAEESPSLRGF